VTAEQWLEHVRDNEHALAALCADVEAAIELIELDEPLVAQSLRRSLARVGPVPAEETAPLEFIFNPED